MKKNLKPIVKRILLDNEEAREDDFVLIGEIIAYFGGADLTISDVAYHHFEYGLPSFESVTRCRRKIQNECPELRTVKGVTLREIEKQEYIEMSRKGEL